MPQSLWPILKLIHLAAGIFVDDILDAVPIDKYFELFKPGAGGDGGFIRVAMNYDTQAQPAEPGAQARSAPVEWRCHVIW